MKEQKRFIEGSFPVKEVSAESAKEKNIQHGHISMLIDRHPEQRVDVRELCLLSKFKR